MTTDFRALCVELEDAYAWCIEEYMTAPAEEDTLIQRARAALRPKPPSLKVLATDKNPHVRCTVAENPNYKSKTLELTPDQYDALKTLLASSQDETLKTLTL